MKKLFLLVAAVIFAFGMNAQKIGVKAGYGMSGYLINFYAPEGSGMSTGLTAGLVAELDLKIIGIRADLTFNQLGSNYDSRLEADEDWAFRLFDVEYDYNENINYFNLGVSVKKGFGPAYVFVGPYLGYALSGTSKETWEGGPATIDFMGTTIPISPTPGTAKVDFFSDASETYNILEAYSDDNNMGGNGDLYNKVDFGANLGIGASFSGAFVEANVSYGFLNFINYDSDLYSMDHYSMKDDATTALDVDAKQNNLFIGLSVGYMFGF